MSTTTLPAVARFTSNLLAFVQYAIGFVFVIYTLAMLNVIDNLATDGPLDGDEDVTAVLFFVLFGAIALSAGWARYLISKFRPVPLALIIALAAFGGYLAATEFAFGVISAVWGGVLAYAGLQRDMARDGGKSRWPWEVVGGVILLAGLIALTAVSRALPDAQGDIAVLFGPAVLFAIVVRLMAYNKLSERGAVAPIMEAPPTEEVTEKAESAPESPSEAVSGAAEGAEVTEAAGYAAMAAEIDPQARQAAARRRRTSQSEE